MRIIVALAFVLIIGSLASALYHMMRGKTTDRKMVWSLTFRVGFSIALFVFILIAHSLGWIHSTGIPSGM